MAYTREQSFESNQTETVKWKELGKLLNDMSNAVIVFKSSIWSIQIVTHNFMLTGSRNNTTTNVLIAVIAKIFHHHNGHYHKYS